MKKKPTYQENATDLDQLVKGLVQGETQAIALIYRSCFKRLLGYGIQVVGHTNKQEVEDVIQDFFIWITQNPQKLEKVRNLEVYMFQSIRRNLISKRQTTQQSELSHNRYLETIMPLEEKFSHSPEQVFIQAEDQAHKNSVIRAELDKLPPYQKEILYLRYFENKSYKEISSILSINHQVAYNYVSRAINLLKKQWVHVPFLLLFLLNLS